MIYALFKLDERSRKVLLVLCALFIILMLVFGTIYFLIDKFMRKQSLKMDTYMYDLRYFGLVKDKTSFKKAVIYYEHRYLFNSSKWPFRFIIILTGAAFAIIYIFFKGNVNGFFTEAFKLIPKIKWPTIGEINELINDSSLKISGPSWMPASVFPTFISKNPDFSSPLLYSSMIYYLAMLICVFMLIRSTLAFMARFHRGMRIANDTFEKNLEKTNFDQIDKINEFNSMVNSPIPNQGIYNNSQYNNPNNYNNYNNFNNSNVTTNTNNENYYNVQNNETNSIETQETPRENNGE